MQTRTVATLLSMLLSCGGASDVRMGQSVVTISGTTVRVAALLEEIVTEGGDYNFLILATPSDAYVQFLGERGASVVIGEAASEQFVPDLDLTDEHERRLRALGWVAGDPNYRQEFEVSTPATREHAATVALRTLEDVYGWTAGQPLSATVNLENAGR